MALAVVLALSDRGFAFSGVQTNVPAASLSGWSLCYSDTYASSGTSLGSILAACDGPNLLLACRPVGSPDLTVLAHAPRADVIFDTGASNTPHDANGVGWYYNDSYSWGFAPQGDPIARNSCDTEFGTDPDKRLCWHSGSGFIIGGWRCGTTAYLNSDSGWERLVYEGSLSCGDGVIDAGEECDDANLTSGDGCSNGCEIEDCYSCTGAPSTCFAQPDGSTCNDGQFCNGGDTCASAACTAHDGDPCAGGGECATTCNEGTDTCADPVYTPCTADTEVCTDDYCDGAGSCTHPGTYYTPCDDGLFCNGTDLCFAGTCSYHYGDPCAYAECNTVCDEPTDMCTPSPIGAFCYDDGNVCTTEACDGAGVCAHLNGPSGVPCPNDGQECTTDECDGAGTCSHPPLANTTPCTSDGNECTNDNCDGAGACAHPAAMDGTGCDDDNLCTQTDQCAAGNCVGANPIVCTPAACFAPETCDPTAGTCTTCPAGYTQGGGGCQRTYAIDASLLDHMPNVCDPTRRYNDCTFNPFGFHWTDAGDASVGAVTRVDVTLETGVDCSYVDHDVGLNGTAIGSYPYSYNCTCSSSTTPQLLADVNHSTYVKGGSNIVLVSTDTCAGLNADVSGAFAVVTVTYADPGPQLAVEASCRTALKSKFQYKNSTTNAKDKLGWKWIKGGATTGAEFGNPTASADYELCVFGQSSGAPTLLFGTALPANASTWSAAGSTGYKYSDSSAAVEGLSKILLKGGAANKSKAILKGKGAGLDDPTVPLAMGTTGILVQLTNESSGLCWQSQFPIAAVTQSAAGIKGSLP